MIGINLLPEDLKAKQKKEAVKAKRFPVIPVVLSVCVLCVIIHASAVSIRAGNGIMIKGLRATWETLEPKKAELAALKKEIHQIDTKIRAIEDLQENRIVWAEVLSAAGDILLPTMWLSDLSYERRGEGTALVFQGYVTGTSEEGTASVGDFIKALETHDSFTRYFPQVELESVRTSMVAGKEVMKFRLICMRPESG